MLGGSFQFTHESKPMKHRTLLAAAIAIACSPFAHANTNAACATAGDHIATVLSNLDGVDAQHVESMKTFSAAQLAALDVKISQGAVAFGLSEADMHAESKAERDAMKAQMFTRYGNTELHRDYEEMLFNCVRASSEVELGQTQETFLATVNEIRRLIG